MTREETLQAYAELFEILTPEALDRLDGLCSETVHFTDPFNKTQFTNCMHGRAMAVARQARGEAFSSSSRWNHRR